MSWIERIKTEFTITTGDGKSYAPNWLNASKAIEYNISEFVFKELAGSLVKRGTPRGTKYAIEVLFQGEDNLDMAQAFEASAADPKPWTIAHPLYGSVLVQPLGLVFDNSAYNVTRITGGVIETISETPDVPTLSAVDKVIADKSAVDTDFLRSYTDNIPQAKVTDIQNMIRNAAATYNGYLAKVTTNEDAEKLNNLYNTANAAFRNAVANTTSAIASTQALISFPAEVAADAVTRLAMLQNLLVYTHTTIAATAVRSAKLLYEVTAGCIITTMLAVAVTPGLRPYSNRRQVAGVIDTILAGYDSYLATLDAIQSLTGATPGSYIPSQGPLTTLSNAVGYTVTALIGIAASSRKPFSFYLEEDSNAILLTNRLYGMKADDSTLNEFLAVNDIGLNELLNIRKGRLITYYK
jgi:hypothetical protein